MNRLNDLSNFDPYIKELFVKNKNRSLSAMFRKLRNKEGLNLIGDYPIMWSMIKVAKKMNLKTSYKQIWLMCSQSKEYKTAGAEKRSWLKEFTDLSKKVN